jgi:hypothetical protein
MADNEVCDDSLGQNGFPCGSERIGKTNDVQRYMSMIQVRPEMDLGLKYFKSMVNQMSNLFGAGGSLDAGPRWLTALEPRQLQGRTDWGGGGARFSR